MIDHDRKRMHRIADLMNQAFTVSLKTAIEGLKGKGACEFQERADGSRGIECTHSCYMMISDAAFHASIRLYFNLMEVGGWIARYGEPADRAAVLDFMKEVANVSVGLLMKSMETSDRAMGVSLPVVNKVFDKVALSGGSDGQTYSYTGKMKIAGSSGLWWLIRTEFIDPSEIGQLEVKSPETQADAANEGDVEFL